MPRAARLLLAAAALAGCAELEPEPELPAGRIYFPSGIAVAGDQLVVASSNFDLRYRAGRLTAWSLAAIDAAVTDAPDPAPGRPARAALPAPTGSVEIGDFSGQIAVAPTTGGQRIFVPIRSQDAVVAVDLPAGGGLRCAAGGGADCTDAGVAFPADDPYHAIVVGRFVYVSHVTLRTDRGRIGAAEVEAPLWSGGAGDLTPIVLAETAVGGLAASCSDPACATGTVFATGRSTVNGLNLLYLFDFGETVRTSRVFVGNIYGQIQGGDTRGIQVSSDGSIVRLVTRTPDALAAIDVSRVPPRPTDACAVQGDLPEGGCPELPLPPEPIAVPVFGTVDLSQAPAEPRDVASVRRVLPGGLRSDLLVVSARQGISIYDPRTRSFATRLQEVGDVPSGAASVPTGAGARLYVPSFATGTLAVVDIPDLLDPGSARVAAILGEPQEGAF